MKKLIRLFACAMGVETSYRVTATMLINGCVATSTMTIDARPWIHKDNIQDIEKLFDEECGSDNGVNLVMIFKL